MLGIGLDLSKISIQSRNIKELTSNLSLWLRNGVGVTPAKWDDSSGNGNNARQSEEEQQGIVSGGGIQFQEDDPGNDVHETHYDLTSAVVVDPEAGFCIAWVMDQESSTNNTLVSNSSAETIRIQNASKIRLLTNDPDPIESIYHTNAAFSSSKGLYMLQRSAGGSSVISLFKNGDAVDYAPSSGNSTLADAGENNNGFSFDTIGAANSGSTHFFDGIIFELAFWSRALTADEIADVNSVLKTQHNI